MLEALGWVFAHPELGWVAVLAYLYIEIRTRWGRVYTLEKKMVSTITVIRAIARVHPGIKEEKVDGYLVSNGHEPGDFITVGYTDPDADAPDDEDEDGGDTAPDLPFDQD